MKCESIVIWRRVRVFVAWNSLDDECYESSKERRDEQCSNSPYKDLAADNDATQIHILLLLLLPRRTQKPALLGFVQRPRRHGCSVEILQVPAPIIVGGGVSRIDLQRTPPRIPTVHTHLALLLSSSIFLLLPWKINWSSEMREKEKTKPDLNGRESL